jgi:glycosyltransferase involved in cell wall biosynthesis
LKSSVRHIDLFLAPSRFTIDAHRSRGFDRPMRLLPQFVPSGEIGSDATSGGSGRPYFLFVGRLERLKGVQVLLDVFSTFREADLVIAGQGTYGDSLRRHANGLDHVRFLGQVDSAQLAGLYVGATALLIPSVGYETFGMVGVEAMARRTPVIVNDLGALPELVAESGGGFVYRTTAELRDAMQRLLVDAELRRHLGERGYDAWQRLWSERPHIEGYLAAVAEARGTSS